MHIIYVITEESHLYLLSEMEGIKQEEDKGEDTNGWYNTQISWTMYGTGERRVALSSMCACEHLCVNMPICVQVHLSVWTCAW